MSMYLRPHGPAGGPHRDLIEFIIIITTEVYEFIYRRTLHSYPINPAGSYR